MTIVTSDSLQALIAAVLTETTSAGANVFTPRTWRTPPAALPILLIQSPSETKQNVAGRTGPAEFWVTGRFRIVGRVYQKPDPADPFAADMAAQAAVDALARQVEVRVINADAIRRAIQQFVSIETVSDVKSDGGLRFGEFDMTISMEFYQGPEAFAPVEGVDFNELALYVDLLNVFSPTGNFNDTPFPGSDTGSPRTIGPDGRAEGLVLIEIDQTLPAPLGGALDLSDEDAPKGLFPGL